MTRGRPEQQEQPVDNGEVGAIVARLASGERIIMADTAKLLVVLESASTRGIELDLRELGDRGVSVRRVP
jgi:hypothetical protein